MRPLVENRPVGDSRRRHFINGLARAVESDFVDLIGYGLIALAAAGVIGVLCLVAVVVVVKRAFRKTTQRALGKVAGAGLGMQGQVQDAVVRIGERELGKGFDAFKKNLSHQALVTNPRRLAAAITKLAQRNKGELAVDNVMAEFDVPQQKAQEALERLVGKEVCNLQSRDGYEVYVFPGFREKRQVKLCEYCDSVYEADEAQNDCLGCGAPLKEVVVTA